MVTVPTFAWPDGPSSRRALPPRTGPPSRPALALILTVTVVLPAVAGAQAAPEAARAEAQAEAAPEASAREETTIVRTPDTVSAPPPVRPLERFFPRLRDERATLTPFLRDTDLNVRLRTFYFNRQNDDDTASEAWAGGGWIQYASGWLLDTAAIGATYYTSWPLYAPDERPGSLLLTPGQDAIGVLGEAWAALRYREYALLRGYRQRIDDGYVNSQDNRMIPNTFEALTLSGTLGWARYDLGYIWNIKPRDSNDFISMSRQAGAAGDDEGLILTSVTLAPIRDVSVYLGNYYAEDVFNTTFARGEYTYAVSRDVKLQVGLQFTDQRAVGEDRLGDFTTWNIGAGARVLWRGLSVGAATHVTDDDASIRSPWGTWPGYLSLMVTDFNRAGEKAFGIGVKYDFGGTLLPFRAPGLSVFLAYAQGTDRRDPATGGGLPTTREGNLDVIYNVPAVKGLSLRFRNGYVGRGDASTVMDFRIIVNYDLDLL